MKLGGGSVPDRVNMLRVHQFHQSSLHSLVSCSASNRNWTMKVQSHYFSCISHRRFVQCIVHLLYYSASRLRFSPLESAHIFDQRHLLKERSLYADTHQVEKRQVETACRNDSCSFLVSASTCITQDCIFRALRSR